MSLYKKILEVMKDIKYLQKDDNVSTGGSGSYKAISEEKVTETVRESLIKNGLIILPIEQEHKRDDTILENNGKQTVSRLTTVNVKYKIVDTDTGEFEILASSGTGVDTQDKGVGKAMTYSYKYMMLRTFAIPTGEDPDKVSSAVLDETLKSDKPISPQTGNEIITKPQANRIFALSGASADICKAVLKKHGYIKSDEVKKKDYDTICKEVQEEAAKGDGDELPWKD